MVQMHGCDLAVLVGGVIVNALVCVAAGGINCDLILTVPHVNTPPLLGDGAENVKELADAFALALTGDGVELRKGAPHKTGGGGQIAGHPHHAHAAAVCVQRQIRCKAVFG